MSEVTFAASSKLAWIEQVATDHGCTDGQVRLAVGISRKLGGEGAAIVTQATLANTIGATERGVRKAAAGLQARGHLEVNSVGCGPGTATTYRPIVKRRNESAGVGGQQGQEHLHFRSGETRNEEARTPEQRSTNTGSFVPPHKNPSKIPIKTPGARAGARDDPARNDPLQLRWQAIKEALAKRKGWGEDKVAAWLDKLEVRELAAGVLTLIAPTRFIATFNTTHHADALLAAWRAIDPSVSRVQIVWQGGNANEASKPGPAIDDALADEGGSPLALLMKLRGA
jgi:DnaA N-terminal domain